MGPINVTKGPRVGGHHGPLKAGGSFTAWLVVIGVPGKPFTWNHPGFHPGETVYPRETPGISSSGAKNKIGGVLGHACADSGPRSWV